MLQILLGLQLKILIFSGDMFLNWSSGRVSPKLNQFDEIAYSMNIAVSELLIRDDELSFISPIWRDNIERTLLENIERYKHEHNINKSQFRENSSNLKCEKFLYYLNGKNKTINLKTLDKLAKLLKVQTYQLVEKENKNEKED